MSARHFVPEYVKSDIAKRHAQLAIEMAAKVKYLDWYGGS